MPALAPLVVLAFLGAGFLVFTSAVGGGLALAARRPGLAKILFGSCGGIAALYGVALIGAALASRERTLRPGERKYFCEMDCHLAYSAEPAARQGGRTAVTVRTWFDPSTIAPFRGDAPLTPNPRTVYLIDAAGRRYAPLAGSGPGNATDCAPLDRTLRPGESHTTTFAFALPEDALSPRLFVGDPAGPENLLIGHENSPLHRKTYFALAFARAGNAAR